MTCFLKQRQLLSQNLIPFALLAALNSRFVQLSAKTATVPRFTAPFQVRGAWTSGGSAVAWRLSHVALNLHRRTLGIVVL